MPLYIAIVVSSWIVTKLPLRVCYALASIIGAAAFVVAGKARRAVTENLSVVLDEPPTSPLVRKTARRAFQNNTNNWVDSLRLGSLSKADLERRVDVIGWDLLEEAAAQGKGVIVIGMHLGNIDVVGQIIAARGYALTIPVERIRPEALFRRTQALRQSLGVRAIPVENSARELLRALKQGGIVGIMADRNVGDTGTKVEFFGRPTVLSKGPAWLATRAQVPVLVGAGIRCSNGRFQGHLTTVQPQRTGDVEADLQVNTQMIIVAVEELIRQHPEQWCMFAPVWNRSATEALIE